MSSVHFHHRGISENESKKKKKKKKKEERNTEFNQFSPGRENSATHEHNQEALIPPSRIALAAQCSCEQARPSSRRT
jgi:hypothetical protein